MDDSVLPRLVVRTMAERLCAMPALVVTGARQAEKCTLARQLTPGTRRYHSLDDLDDLDVLDDLDAARPGAQDPRGLAAWKFLYPRRSPSRIP